ncbi:hypothetical protein [Peribacillus simplex]|uniref:hypothetical protein n=1 Tax=Peribacillus simplex TaxID=1478 RepID=UPI0011A81D7B|nr:hypothetical protein [Peribacillus simplex]
MSNKCDDQDHQFKKFFNRIPVNYPVGIVYLNGFPVEVSNLSNLNSNTELAYFVGAEGKIVLLDTAKIDSLSFGQAEEPDAEC